MDLGRLQRDAAELICCSTATLRNWEWGTHRPEVRFWPAIIRFLGHDPSPQARTTAERLKAVRRATGWSQKRLAFALGVDPTAVRDWEAGKKPHFHRCRAAVEKLLREFGA